MNEATQAAQHIEFKTMDFTGMMLEAVKRPLMQEINRIGWIHWPYWGLALKTAGIVLLLWLAIWFYNNWIR